MNSVELLGYCLVVLLGIEGPMTTQLFKTGEISRTSKKKPLMVLLYTVLHGVVLALVIFYIAWKFFGWQHLALYFITTLTLGEWLYKKISLDAAWTTSTALVIVAAICEYQLLLSL